MAEDNSTQTWDSVTGDTPNAVVDTQPPPEAPSDTQHPVQSDAAPQNPPAEASPLETTETAQVEPETEPVRESESLTPEQPEPEKPKDDYVAEADDPPEIAALSTPAAKRWAQRQFKDAAPTRKFVSYDVPISEFGDDLASRSPSRYTEHVQDVIRHHYDYIAQQLFGMKYEDVKERLGNGQPSTTPETVSTTIPTAEELNSLTNEEIVERWKQQLATAQPTEETEKLRSQVGELQKQLEAVTGKITSTEQTERQNQVVQIQNDVYSQVWKVVDECKRDWGLEVKADDPPRIANLKRAAARILDSDTEPVFDEDESNRKVVEYVVNAAKRLEKDNAFREVDNLKVRARAAATKVKESPEVKEILDEINAYATKSKAVTRATSPAPPAPGSSTGVTIKPPTTWDEAIEQSRAVA